MKVYSSIILSLLLFNIFLNVYAEDKVETKEEVNGNETEYVAEDSFDEKSNIKIFIYKNTATTSSFATEWEQEMSNYDPDYVYMIPLNFKTKHTYFEDITTIPARIRGAFIVNEEKKDNIDFEIIGPRSNVVYRNTTNECIFDLEVNDIGRYTILFNNRYLNEEVQITFTMNTGQNPILKKDDLSFTDKKLDSLFTFIKRFNLESKLNRNLHRERYVKIAKTNKYFYTFSVIETLVLVCISVWQFYYMRQLFEIKGSL